MKTNNINSHILKQTWGVTQTAKISAVLMIIFLSLNISCSKEKKTTRSSVSDNQTTEITWVGGANAQFSIPSGVAVDAQGTVYVADTFNCRIRKITKEGVVSTLAGGNDTKVFKDGIGTDAAFNKPQGVAVDKDGILYVADTGNSRIRKITKHGAVTTIGGTGQFAHPYGVAVDAQGTIYVADTYNHRIQKITPGGVVTTLVGSADANGDGGFVDGKGTVVKFRHPHGVAVDAQGNVYVSDTGNSSVRKITPDGTVTTLAGSVDANGNGGFVDGKGTAAKFKPLEGITVDAQENVYVADIYNFSIRKITKDGVVTTPVGYDSRLGGPSGIAVDAQGRMYIAYPYDNIIRKI